MTPQTDLSVCILTHAQPVLLPQCVVACLSEIQRAQLSAEIIIIDNASADRYPNGLTAVSPMIRIIRTEQNLGFGAGNNRAIRASCGRLVLLINDDAMLQDGSLGLMIRALEADERVGAVGPALVFPDGSLQSPYMNKRLPHLRGMVCEFLELDQWLSRYAWTRRALTLWDDPEKRAEPEQLAGACILVRRHALDRVGLFDEGFYYILEDADLCQRLHQDGWRILCLYGARVTHYGAATFTNWAEAIRIGNYFRSVTYYFKKHSTPAKHLLTRLILSAAIVVSISRKALLGVFRRALHREAHSYTGLGFKVRAKIRFMKSIFSAGQTRRMPE
ncbi:MAG TPA: glycosyltransferase family 2 protein [Terriglobia bacterium]|nr:glycosyltransferase family 2 protein [Terriglobia bacterium]